VRPDEASHRPASAGGSLHQYQSGPKSAPVYLSRHPDQVSFAKNRVSFRKNDPEFPHFHDGDFFPGDHVYLGAFGHTISPHIVASLFVQDSGENHPAKRRPYPRSVGVWVLPCVTGRGEGNSGSSFPRRRSAGGTGVLQVAADSLRRRMNLAQTIISTGTRRPNQSTPPDPPSPSFTFRPLLSLQFPVKNRSKLYKKPAKNHKGLGGSDYVLW